MELSERNQLIAFLEQARSPYHTVQCVKERLTLAGYVPLEGAVPQPGGKYYTVRGGSSLIALELPEGNPQGFLMTAAHTDYPTFRLKDGEPPAGAYARLDTEKYGGMLLSTWLDRPLSVAGRVTVETPTGVQTRLWKSDRELAVIPSVAIHLNRSVNEGYRWNPAVDTLPLVGLSGCEGLVESIARELDATVLGHDLSLYVSQVPTVVGQEEDFLCAQGLDDLACVWSCMQGLLRSPASGSVKVLCLFDSEEVGSRSAQGAGSDFLRTTLEGLCGAMGWALPRLLGQSLLLSADNAHGVHPNHPELSDRNAPVLGGGPVLKFNAGGSYATGDFSAAVVRKIAKDSGVTLQSFYNRADLPCGSTLGGISMGKVSVPTADVGIAQLAMHSCYETAALKDMGQMTRLLAACYGTTLTAGENGRWVVG